MQYIIFVVLFDKMKDNHHAHPDIHRVLSSCDQWSLYKVSPFFLIDIKLKLIDISTKVCHDSAEPHEARS